MTTCGKLTWARSRTAGPSRFFGGRAAEARNDADSALAVETVGSGPSSGADLKSLGYFLKTSAFLAQGDYDGADDAVWGIAGDPNLAPIYLRYLIPWVDEVLAAADGGKPVQLVPLYKTLGTKIYDSLTSMLSNEDDAWDIR